MDKNYFITLTQKLYRVTFFFPSREPLRNRLREMGDQILSNLVLILEGKIEERMDSSFDVEKNIEMLDALLELAKTQNWIDRGEIEKIQDNYTLIKREVAEFNDIIRRRMALKEEEKTLAYQNKQLEEKNQKQHLQQIAEKEIVTRYERKYPQISTGTLKEKAEEVEEKIRKEQERLLREKKQQEEIMQKINRAKEESRWQGYARAEQKPAEPVGSVSSALQERSVSEALKSAQNATKTPVVEKKPQMRLNKRQQKIIDLLKKRDRMQVRDFQEFVPTTKRTLRRDLLALVENNVIKRTGRGNVTYYSNR